MPAGTQEIELPAEFDLVHAIREGADRMLMPTIDLDALWSDPAGRDQPGTTLAFAVMGAMLMGTLGLIAGLWAEKFDQLAAFQNFVVMPMTFLSGVFYSIHSLPPFWQQVSHLNPFFYMIDGFRYGFFGVSDVSPWLSLGLVGGAYVLVAALALHLLRIGYKIRG